MFPVFAKLAPKFMWRFVNIGRRAGEKCPEVTPENGVPGSVNNRRTCRQIWPTLAGLSAKRAPDAKRENCSSNAPRSIFRAKGAVVQRLLCMFRMVQI